MVIQNFQKREIFLRIANRICKKYNTDINKLYKRRGKKNIIRCKLILFYILKTLFTCTQKELYAGLLPPIYFANNPVFLREIAESLNVKSHCNILHAVKTVNNWIYIYKNEKHEIEYLYNKCRRLTILYCYYNNIDYNLHERK